MLTDMFFLYFHAQKSIKISICFSNLKSEKKIMLNEINEQEYSKAPSLMSSYTQEHVLLYLHLNEHPFGTSDFAAFLWSNFPSKHSLLLNKKRRIILKISE